MALSRVDFIRQIQTDFPEAIAEISNFGGGLLHIEVAVFRRLTEEAMDAGRAWLAERHFRFVERILKDAGAELQNAIEISYIEDLALGDHRERRHRIVKERMPRALRKRMIAAHGGGSDDSHGSWRL